MIFLFCRTSSKKWCEQAAAVVCLRYLGLHDGRKSVATSQPTSSASQNKDDGTKPVATLTQPATNASQNKDTNSLENQRLANAAANGCDENKRIAMETGVNGEGTKSESKGNGSEISKVHNTGNELASAKCETNDKEILSPDISQSNGGVVKNVEKDSTLAEAVS